MSDARSGTSSPTTPRSPRDSRPNGSTSASTSTVPSRTPHARSTHSTPTRPRRSLEQPVNRIALPHHYSGKVRELYEVDHDRMLVVASDRISVFDVVLDDVIPDKGRVLTALSTFWFDATAAIVPS